MKNSLWQGRFHSFANYGSRLKCTPIITSLINCLLVLTCLLLLLGDCTTVSRVDESGNSPFQAFSRSVLELHQGTDQALADIVTMSSNRFLHEALLTTGEGEVNKVEELRIAIPADPLSRTVSL